MSYVILFFIQFSISAGGESFEGFGENESNEQANNGGIDLVLAPHNHNSSNHMYVQMKINMSSC